MEVNKNNVPTETTNLTTIGNNSINSPFCIFYILTQKTTKILYQKYYKKQKKQE